MDSHGSVIFIHPDALEISPAVRCSSKRPLAKLVVECAEEWPFGGCVHDGCEGLVRWLSSRPPKSVTFTIWNLPGFPWESEDFDYWAWYDRVMAEVAAWDPPPILVDVGCFSVTYRGEVLWPPESRRVQRRADRRTQPPGAPFPLGWYGQGLGGYRPCESTYDCYPPDELPPIRVPLTGTFDWLRAAPKRVRSIAGDPGKTDDELAKLVAAVPVGLPAEFVEFLRSPELWSRIRSVTDCYLHLDEAAGEIRGGSGRLVRFLSDSQYCRHWCLHLSPCGTRHSVVATYVYTGSDCGRPWGSGVTAHPRDITTCAASFEEFVYRFWLENELCYTSDRPEAMPVGGAEYLAFYHDRASPT